MILSFTCKWINQSKGMSTKQYNSKKNQKQTQETKHNIAQNMSPQPLINYIQQENQLIVLEYIKPTHNLG